MGRGSCSLRKHRALAGVSAPAPACEPARGTAGVCMRARARAMDVRFCARVHVRVDAGVDQAQGAAPVFSAFVGVCGFMGLWLSSRRLSGFVETKGRSLTEIQRQLSL